MPWDMRYIRVKYEDYPRVQELWWREGFEDHITEDTGDGHISASFLRYRDVTEPPRELPGPGQGE